MGQEERQGNALIFIGLFIVSLTFVYFFGVTFLTVPLANQRYSDLILGYISGLVSAIVGYYWGGSNRHTPSGINIPQGDSTKAVTSSSVETTDEPIKDVEDNTKDDDDDDELTPPLKG